MNAPLYLARSGLVASYSLYNAGSRSFYWSSTIYSEELARDLNFNSDNIYSMGNDNRYFGISLRCVLREA